MPQAGRTERTIAMMESFLGPTAPMWSAHGSSGLGWSPGPSPFNTRPLAQPMPLAQPVPLTSPVPYPPFGIAEFINGPTAATLVTVVAMRRGQPAGPTSDAELEDFLYDAIEFLAGTNDVEVRCDSGRVTLLGNVPNKRLKHDVGEIAWAIPAVVDLQNNVTIATRRRARASNREADSHPAGSARKTA